MWVIMITKCKVHVCILHASDVHPIFLCVISDVTTSFRNTAGPRHLQANTMISTKQTVRFGGLS